MSSMVPATGSSRLAAVFKGNTKAQLDRQRPQVEWATMVDLGNYQIGVKPDSWSAEPFGPGRYAVVEPLVAGLVLTQMATVPDSGVPGGGADSHTHGSHGHGEHRHELQYGIPPLQAGERVVITWLAAEPLVLGRIKR
jgi:hypothetical protein